MRRPVMAAMVVAVAGICGMALWSGSRAMAAPDPSPVPISWELKFVSHPPERIEVEGKTYWYIRYTITNTTGKDILFTPEFELMTDTGQVLPAFKEVPKAVFTRIKALYNNSLLMSPTAILGKLLQGEDNSRDGLILFSGVETESREFQFFTSGLSGETAEVKNPLTGKPAVLKKTLVLDYNIPGMAIGVDPQPKLKAMKWVMK